MVSIGLIEVPRDTKLGFNVPPVRRFDLLLSVVEMEEVLRHCGLRLKLKVGVIELLLFIHLRLVGLEVLSPLKNILLTANTLSNIIVIKV